MRRLNAGFGVGISFGAIVLSALAGCGGSELDPASSASSPAPSPVASAPNVIKIVSSLPRTGSANAQTTTICNGIKMAIDEIGGTIHTNNGDFTIAYEDWDDASPQRGNWDPAVEAANSDKAIKDADIMAYIGTFNSGAAKISMPKLNKASLVMISPANTYPGLTKPGLGEANEPMSYRPTGKINFFRVVPADDIQGSHDADWAKELGAKSVFVLHDRELYGKGIADVFKKRAQQIGLKVVGYEGIDNKASNYKSLVVKIKEQNPDLVFFGGTTQTNGGQIGKDLVAGGLNVKYMVPDGCYEKAFIEAAGAQALEGRAYLTFGGVPPKMFTGKGKQFYDNYKKTYNAEPEAYAAYGYEAAKVVLEAIARAGKKDREAIRQAVAATKDFTGALGTWSFDENGDTTLKTMSGNSVKDGDFVFIKILGQ